MKRKIIIGLAALLSVAFIKTGPATAQVILLPGGGPTALPGSAPNIGTLVTSTVIPFSTSPWSGNVYEYVFTDTVTTGLDFLYAIDVTGGNGNSGIDRFTASNFTGFATTVDVWTGFGGVDPSTADRSLSGDTVGFNFPNQTTLGSPSGLYTYSGNFTDYMWIATDATNYGAGQISIIDSTTQTLAAIGPTAATAAVPEPSTLLILGSGLVGTGFWFRRRNA